MSHSGYANTQGSKTKNHNIALPLLSWFLHMPRKNQPHVNRSTSEIDSVGIGRPANRDMKSPPTKGMTKPKIAITHKPRALNFIPGYCFTLTAMSDKYH